MTWVEITHIERSRFNEIDKLIFFEFQGEERFAVVSGKVLDYLDIKDIEDYKQAFIIQTFSKVGEPIFVVKKVR